MADPYVRQARGVFSATLGVAVTAGDLVYFDGTNWLAADADDNTKFAEAIAVNTLIANDVGNLCTSCIIVDTDAPFTQGDQYFLSATAGAITATRPATAANLKQVVGFGLSTTELRAEIKMVHEVSMDYHLHSNTQAEQFLQLDVAGSGDMMGGYTDADDEDIGATFAMPDNAVGIEIAFLYMGSEVVSAATDYDITVSGANDGEQWDAGTQDTTLASQVVSGAAADEIHRVNVTTGFDAATVLSQDNVIGFHCTHDGCQSDKTIALSLHIVWLCV